MFSKNKKKVTLDTESREQYEYARKRVSQKKNLMSHFVTFLAGSILIIILSTLGVGKDILPNDWYIFVILIWTFIFLIHLFNVFISNKFMGKEWEDRQLEKLKAAQESRISELKKQAILEVTVAQVQQERTAPENLELKKNETNPNLLPPDNQ